MNLVNEIKMIKEEIENTKTMLSIKENRKHILRLILEVIGILVFTFIFSKFLVLILGGGDRVLLNPRISWITTESDALFMAGNTVFLLPFSVIYVIPKIILTSIENHFTKKELKSKGIKLNKKVSLDKVKFLEGELIKKKSELNKMSELKKESISSLTESQKMLYRERLERMYKMLDFYKKNKNRIKKLYKNNSLDDLIVEEGISYNDINYIRTLVKKDLKR